MTNTTNGALTNYSLTFTTNTPIYTGDSLYLTFPIEITLPQQSNLKCTSSKNIIELTCSKMYASNSAANAVQIYLNNVAGISENNQFIVTFSDIQNAFSLRPTSPFSGIVLSDNGNN